MRADPFDVPLTQLCSCGGRNKMPRGPAIRLRVSRPDREFILLPDESVERYPRGAIS
jgi:hypothetical protein